VPRRLLLVAVWVVGTAAAGLLAWAGVAVVADRVTDTPIALSEQAPPPSAPAGPDGPGTTATTTPGTSPPPPARQVTAVGGTASISCADGLPALDWATPRPGFEVDVEQEGADPAEGEPGGLRVRFRGDEAESRVFASCDSGAPVVEVEERD
jgi:hypothetical protein